MSGENEVMRATEILTERKLAGGFDPHCVNVVSSDVIQRTLVGLDLNLDEVNEVAIKMAQGVMPAIVAGLPWPQIVASMWADGLATGVLLEREVRREGAVR